MGREAYALLGCHGFLRDSCSTVKPEPEGAAVVEAHEGGLTATQRLRLLRSIRQSMQAFPTLMSVQCAACSALQALNAAWTLPLALLPDLATVLVLHGDNFRVARRALQLLAGPSTQSAWLPRARACQPLACGLLRVLANGIRVGAASGGWGERRGAHAASHAPGPHGCRVDLPPGQQPAPLLFPLLRAVRPQLVVAGHFDSRALAAADLEGLPLWMTAALQGGLWANDLFASPFYRYRAVNPENPAQVVVPHSELDPFSVLPFDLSPETLWTPHACDYCNGPVRKATPCLSCAVGRYCSTQCRQAAWPTHRAACGGRNKLIEGMQAASNVSESWAQSTYTANWEEADVFLAVTCGGVNSVVVTRRHLVKGAQPVCCGDPYNKLFFAVECEGEGIIQAASGRYYRLDCQGPCNTRAHHRG